MGDTNSLTGKLQPGDAYLEEAPKISQGFTLQEYAQHIVVISKPQIYAMDVDKDGVISEEERKYAYLMPSMKIAVERAIMALKEKSNSATSLPLDISVKQMEDILPGVALERARAMDTNGDAHLTQKEVLVALNREANEHQAAVSQALKRTEERLKSLESRANDLQEKVFQLEKRLQELIGEEEKTKLKKEPTNNSPQVEIPPLAFKSLLPVEVISEYDIITPLARGVGSAIASNKKYLSA